MTSNRLQLALNVADLDEASGFYTRLFGAPPHKVRPGYVNFAIADPPLKLVLFEAPGAQESLNHLGVELVDSEQVDAAASRFEQAGLSTRVSEQEVCCHAAQSKVYVDAPDVPLGFWEFYTVLDEEPERAGSALDGECCGEASEREACCA